jgi:hypothetical protein
MTSLPPSFSAASVASFLFLFSAWSFAMPLMFLFFAMSAVAAMHAVAEQVHSDKKDEEYDEKPVFSDPVHSIAPIYMPLSSIL